MAMFHVKHVCDKSLRLRAIVAIPVLPNVRFT
jgi:hypothetical protein